MSNTLKAARCRYGTIQRRSESSRELSVKCVPRTKPGESPAFWQELGWAKNWITLPIRHDPCVSCNRFAETEAGRKG
jgi:hypothetical protein